MINIMSVLASKGLQYSVPLLGTCIFTVGYFITLNSASQSRHNQGNIYLDMNIAMALFLHNAATVDQVQ